MEYIILLLLFILSLFSLAVYFVFECGRKSDKKETLKYIMPVLALSFVGFLFLIIVFIPNSLGIMVLNVIFSFILLAIALILSVILKPLKNKPVGRLALKIVAFIFLIVGFGFSICNISCNKFFQENRYLEKYDINNTVRLEPKDADEFVLENGNFIITISFNNHVTHLMAEGENFDFYPPYRYGSVLVESEFKKEDMLKGALPKTDQEIAITTFTSDHLFYGEKEVIGKKINISGKDLTVTGIINLERHIYVVTKDTYEAILLNKLVSDLLPGETEGKEFIFNKNKINLESLTEGVLPTGLQVVLSNKAKEVLADKINENKLYLRGGYQLSISGYTNEEEVKIYGDLSAIYNDILKEDLKEKDGLYYLHDRSHKLRDHLDQENIKYSVVKEDNGDLALVYVISIIAAIIALTEIGIIIKSFVKESNRSKIDKSLLN